uniref:Uncharacterized protein n=1 Tax=Anguilla anguilla TaxID=7936 RepID=A0A0E9P6Z6_ANGAN
MSAYNVVYLYILQYISKSNGSVPTLN